jgi:hypothetical protein
MPTAQNGAGIHSFFDQQFPWLAFFLPNASAEF